MRWVCATGLALPVLFLIPPLLRIDRVGTAVNVVLTASRAELQEFIGAFLRTVGVSLAAGFGSIAVGLAASLGILNAGCGLSRFGSLVLVVPFFLGEAVIAFVMRLALDTQWNTVHTTDWPVPATLAVIAAGQMLRFGSLFAFVMIARSAQLGRDRVEFATVYGLSRGRYIRDVVVPGATSTLQVCCCMAFGAAMVDDTMADLVFRASPGNQLELLSHWNGRHYRLMSSSSPQVARDVAAIVGGFEFIMTLLLGTLVFLAARPLLRGASALLVETGHGRNLTSRWYEVAVLRMLHAYGLTLMAAVALVFVARWDDFDAVALRSMAEFGPTIALGLLTGGLTALGAAVLAILCTMSWPIAFSGLTRGTVVVLASSLLLSAVPSTYLLLASYDWALAVLRTQFGSAAWIVGHAATVGPLLFGFFVVTHFAMKATEMEFHLAHGVHFRQIMARAFVERFGSSYGLGAFCAFALIWNERTINSTFISSVPSFAAVLNQALEGRTASVGSAAACSVTSLVTGLLCAYYLSGMRREATR